MPKVKQPSLAECLKALPPSRPHQANPFSNLPDVQKKEWKEVCKLIRSGGLKHLSLNEIRRRVSERFKFIIPKSTFRDLLVREGALPAKE